VTTPDLARRIELDASDWRTTDDFYLALLPGLGAPDWHGHNLNALWDSLVGGEINAFEPPFDIEIKGMLQATHDVREIVRCFSDLAQEMRRKDVPVFVSVEAT